MAARAIAASLEAALAMRHVDRCRIDVALNTKQALLAPIQQHLIYAAVRRVASGTSFHLHGRMLEYEWAALLDVAIHASLPSCLPEGSAVG